MRWRIPWALASALGVVYLGLAGAAPTRHALDPSGYATIALALFSLLAARSLLGSRSRAAESWPAWLFVAAVAWTSASFATGVVAPSRAVEWARAAAIGSTVGSGVWIVLVTGVVRPRRLLSGTLALASAGATVFVRAFPTRVPAWALEYAWVAPLLIAAGFLARWALTIAPGPRARWIYPILGCVGAGLGAVAAITRIGRSSVAPGLSVSAGLTMLSLGVVAGVSGAGAMHAARVARHVGAMLLGASVGAGVMLATGRGMLAAVATGVVALGALPWIERNFRPDQGRLLDACSQVIRRVAGAEQLRDLAALVLEPLRGAAGDLRSSAEAWLLPLEQRITIDVAGQAAVSPLSAARVRDLLTWMRGRPGEPVFTDVLLPGRVRRAEVRPVVEVLETLGAWCALPLRDGDELCGVILVPRGQRTARPALEEESALRDVADAVSGCVARMLATERARVRGEEATKDAVSARAANERLVHERDVAEARLGALRSVQAIGSLEDTWVGYSEPMRALGERLEKLAPDIEPVAFVAEPGSDVVAAARRLHEGSPRAGAAFALVDAAAIHPRDALTTVVGGGDRSGWLEIAAGGTLFIEELPALGHEALVAVGRAITEHRARRVGADDTYPVDVRLIVSVRTLPADAGLPDTIARLFDGRTVHLPPLRARPEDIDHLVLLGIDRACRIHAREVVGISRDAMAALKTYHWPGNARELFEALEHAARRARGSLIRLEDLPVQTRTSFRPPAMETEAPATDEIADESFEALERRILQSALDRTRGNKSEAARILGLARTTFFDKLKKHGLSAG